MSVPTEAIDSSLLPPLLQDFERLIGLKATMDLVRSHGGLRIYIPSPARVHPDHPIARLIGEPNLRRLAEVYGGEAHFTIPKAEQALLALRNARIARDYATCKTARELAAEHGLGERQIERIVASLDVSAPADRRQATLF